MNEQTSHPAPFDPSCCTIEELEAARLLIHSLYRPCNARKPEGPFEPHTVLPAGTRPGHRGRLRPAPRADP